MTITNGSTARPALADSLSIHIIGAGMGGTAAALALAKQGFTNITVWEHASTLGEVGAGINITPNMSRILQRWGVLPIASNEGTPLDGASVLDCASDKVLTKVEFSYIERDFGYPFFTVHRASLQKALITGVRDSGVVKMHLGKNVVSYDFDETKFLVEDRKDGSQEWVSADVLLCSDGVKSKARVEMMKRKGEEDHVEDTGQAAYRILVKREMINEDPDLVPFFAGSHSYRWIGEKRHIIAYPISSHSIFNMSTAHPDRKFVEADTWTASGSKQEMLEMFHDFCPRVQKLLSLVPEGEVLEWKLRVHAPIPDWIDGAAALVGDACHPTLPHLAQGAAQAVEDGAVLGSVIARLENKQDINRVLRVYQALRKPHADWAVATAASNGKGLHLAKGSAAAEERDRLFEAARGAGGSNPDKAIDKDTQSRLYSHDCVAHAEAKYDETFAQLA